MKRDPYDWAVEKEPSYARSSSPRYALNGNGTLRTELARRASLSLCYGGPCSVCNAQDCTCPPDTDGPCELDHEAMKAPGAFSALKFVGYQPTYDEEGKPTHLEMRNAICCGTTLCVPVTIRNGEVIR